MGTIAAGWQNLQRNGYAQTPDTGEARWGSQELSWFSNLCLSLCPESLSHFNSRARFPPVQPQLRCQLLREDCSELPDLGRCPFPCSSLPPESLMGCYGLWGGWVLPWALSDPEGPTRVSQENEHLWLPLRKYLRCIRRFGGQPQAPQFAKYL